jgi:Zn-dependent peptidase ImmA (M78 family)
MESDAVYSKPEDVRQAALDNGIDILPFDIEKFITMHDIAVVREDMADNDLSGFLEKRKRRWVIGVNKYHNRRRQRFTFAHEFAHFCLHRTEVLQKEGKKLVDSILFRDSRNTEIEREANEFASELLIPQKEFRERLRRATRDIDELSSIFDVSPAAIRYKAFRLGIIKRY